MIYQSDIDFMEEAKKAFQDDPRMETYRDKDETRIALRYGMFRDGMVIYKLDGKVGHFAEVMDRAPELETKKEVRVTSIKKDMMKEYYELWDRSIRLADKLRFYSTFTEQEISEMKKEMESIKYKSYAVASTFIRESIAELPELDKLKLGMK